MKGDRTEHQGDVLLPMEAVAIIVIGSMDCLHCPFHFVGFATTHSCYLLPLAGSIEEG